jgi:D-amino-acid dehydrogenase
MVLAALPHRFEPGKSALTDLLSQAAPAWTKFAQSLGRPDHLRMDGHYITWCNDKAAAKGKRHWLTADTGTTQFREADANETEQIQTLTRLKIAGAIRCIGSGQIHDLSELLEDAKQRFLALGGTVMTDKVAMLLEQAGRCSVRLANGQTLTADIVIVAAGIGSKQLLKTIGYRVPMIAERGYHVQYAPGAWSGDVPPVVFEEYGMIVTRFASVVRAASFVEFTTADSPADPKKWRRIERNVSELGLQLGARLDAWHGSRPTLPDYLPAIGKSKRADNLYYAFGHNHLGLTLAPITAEIIGAMVCGNVPAKAFSAFDLERFA